jgi:hypothetical protein
MRKPSTYSLATFFCLVVIIPGLALSGCIWDFQEGCDDGYGECTCDSYDCGDGYVPDTSGEEEEEEEEQDTEEEETPEDYWTQHDCENQDPENPCQEAICEAIASYIEALADCVEVDEECNCTFLEGCLVVYIDCIGGSCVDQDNHEVGEMIDCSLDFALCIDPC